MGEAEQAQPLAAAAATDKQARRRKMKWCGCISISLLLNTVITIILALTVFKAKDPKITMNQIMVTDLDVKLDPNRPFQIKVNLTLAVAMTINNPNAVSFSFSNTTTTMYYRGTLVAEAYGPPGKAKAHGDSPMNLTVDILADRLVGTTGLLSDINSGELNMTSLTIVRGRVNIWNIVKKHVVINMNCSLTIDISGKSVKDMKCKRKVKL